MSSESISRTFIGSVVCVDLVGYSTKSTAQQSAIKQVFNGLLATALKGVPAEDRIILDTGDGAAISFLGDPESSLAVGLELRKVMCERAAELGATGEGPDQGPVRIGINLGPVKLAMDLNGYPKIIGDGINVAERIMSFAKPGQMVASRSFHDMVSRLSDENAALFRYEGVRTDKNVRDHEIYIVEPAPAKARSATLPPVAARAAPAATSPGGLAGFLNDKFKVGFAALLLVAVIAAEALLLATRSPADPLNVASAPAPAPAPASAPAESSPAPAVATPPAPVPAPSAPLVTKVEPASAPRKTPEPEKPAAKPAAPAVAKSAPEPEKLPAAKAAAPAMSAPAQPVKPAPVEPLKPAPAKSASIEPPKPAPSKSASIEQPKSAPPKALGVDPPKTAARKPEEPARFAAPMPTAPVPAAPVPEPPKEEAKPAVPAPTATVILLSRARVEFPVEAAARRIDAGIVKARVTINAAGGVSNVQILEARPRRYFDGEATRALKLFKFNPGLEGRTYEVEIEFQR